MRQVGQMETNMTNCFIFIEKDFNTKKKQIQKDMQFIIYRIFTLTGQGWVSSCSRKYMYVFLLVYYIIYCIF